MCWLLLRPLGSVTTKPLQPGLLPHMESFHAVCRVGRTITMRSARRQPGTNLSSTAGGKFRFPRETGRSSEAGLAGTCKRAATRRASVCKGKLLGLVGQVKCVHACTVLASTGQGTVLAFSWQCLSSGHAAGHTNAYSRRSQKLTVPVAYG